MKIIKIEFHKNILFENSRKLSNVEMGNIYSMDGMSDDFKQFVEEIRNFAKIPGNLNDIHAARKLLPVTSLILQ